MSVHHIDCIVCSEEFVVSNKYGTNACPKCGQKYIWTESYEIVLSDAQLAAAREAAKPKPTGQIHHL